ncbi:helix-turn-helix domain-containing protein [Kordiimonas sp. SCSIO 12610]|uniref:AraC family transcriptional regulator n=1 Tax=Kordiimonas sp. SCSIO 12610 TaxID=2829597 RepID=UPI00210DC455|nr:helix-turn-helix domain-containing protein [Kordiimonas sp. SCSIO 12610]UTW54955.1 AraC family transcriptional regulator [Kordiimonas sp. SCSIO 12610]
MAIEFYDSFFRFGAIVTMLWSAFLLAKYFPNAIQARLGGAAAISISGFLIVSIYDETAIFGRLGVPLVLVAELNPGLTWLFCLSLFKDNFKIQPAHWLVVIFYVLSAIIYQFDILTDYSAVTTSRLVRIAIYGYLIYVIIAGRNEDLVEERRSFRLWLVGAVIAATAFISIAELFYPDFYDLGYGSLSQAAVIFVISLFLLSHITRVNDQVFFVRADDVKIGKVDNAIEDTDLSAEDRHGLNDLQASMTDGIYKEAGLTISMLSERLNIPEHRLRKLINHHLGYQNFSQFLNEYRVDDAKRRLSKIEERHNSVLTIAMDLGYQSLGPFNRAFKNRTGQTPTEFRRQQLQDKV